MRSLANCLKRLNVSSDFQLPTEVLDRLTREESQQYRTLQKGGKSPTNRLQAGRNVIQHYLDAVQGDLSEVVKLMPADAQTDAPAFDRDSSAKELVELQGWLDDADVTDPDYDSKSIRAQLLEQKLKSTKPSDTAVDATVESKPLTQSPDVLRLTPGGPLAAGKSIADAWQKFMTSAGNLPQEAFELAQKKDNSIARELEQLKFERSKLQDAIGGKLSPAGAEQVNNALRGDASALATLPVEARDAVGELRRHIDALSRRLIDNGLATGKLEVSIADNMGTYITRSYQVFDDPKWKGKVEPTVRNKAFTLLKGQSPTLTDQQINNMIDDMLTKEGASSYITGGRLGSKDLSITKARKDIAPEIRALLGEYKDPYVNTARAITKMAHLASNHEFLTGVRDAGLGKFFFERDDASRPSGYNSEMAAESSEVMSPLNGLMTTPEIKQAFDSMYGPKGMGNELLDGLFKWYMKGVVATKYAKTVLSPQATIRNFMGNPMFAVQNGHWNLGKFAPAFMAQKEALRPALPAFLRNLTSSDAAWQKRFLRYSQLGVVHGDTYSGELKAALRDASMDVPAEVEGNWLFRAVKKGGPALAEVYQGVDSFWKIYAFENEVARYKSAYESAGIRKSEAEIEAEAARIVRDTYPNYGMVPALVKALRMWPVTGAFVSFPSEVIRTTYHSFKQTASELQNPALRGIGAQRLAGNLLSLAIPGAVAAGLRMLAGISQDDDEDLRQFVPPWSKNSDIAWLYKGTDGKPGWIDMSYTLPSSAWRKPLNALLAGDDWESSFKDAAKEFLGPYLGEELLTQRFIDVARNKKSNGGEVFNESASDLEKLKDSTLHIAEAMEPGALTSARRIRKAAKGTVEPSGRAYDLKQEILAVGTGMRIQETDIPASLGYATAAYTDATRNATRIFTSKYGSRGTVEPGEVDAAYQEAEASRKQLFDDMARKAQAAINLGVPQTDVKKIMQANGMSADNIRGVLAGRYTPYKPSEEVEKRARTSPAYSTRKSELRQSIAK